MGGGRDRLQFKRGLLPYPRGLIRCIRFSLIRFSRTHSMPRRAGLMESPRFIPVRKPYTPRRNDVDPYGAPPPRGVGTWCHCWPILAVIRNLL